MSKITKQVIALTVSVAIIVSLFTCYVSSDYGMSNVPLEHGKILDCFGWSYANIKSNAESIAESGYKSVMVSPLQSTQTDTAGLTFADWAKMYESVKYDFGNSALGTESSFTDMCAELDKYGTAVIVQVVVGDNIVVEDNEWDLLGFLYATVAHGADGIYLIGADSLTVGEGYWSSLIADVNRYASQYYGNGKSISFFAEATESTSVELVDAGIKLVDDYGAEILNADILKNDGAVTPAELDTDKIHRVENRVSYMSGTEAAPALYDIAKAWALTAARKDSMAVYFVRPENEEAFLGSVSNMGWSDTEVVKVNKFANYFEGISENIYTHAGSAVQTVIIERGVRGAVLVKTGGNGSSVNIPSSNMEAGTYTENVTGNTFTVVNSVILGNLGATGIGAVYNSAPNCPHPKHDTNGVCDGCGFDIGHTFIDGACSCGVDESVKTNIKLYFENNDNWKAVNAYVSDANAAKSDWPGLAMSRLRDGAYLCSVANDAVSVAFNDGDTYQTVDFSVEPCALYNTTGLVGYKHEFENDICTFCGFVDDDVYVYLYAEHMWPSAEYDYAVWSWSNINGMSSVWVYPDNDASVNGYTAFQLRKDCEMVIFAAFPKGSVIDWSNRKYQTQNLNLNENRYYTVGEDRESWEGWSLGTWISTPCVHSWTENKEGLDFDCSVAHTITYNCTLCDAYYKESADSTSHMKPADESLITVVTPPTCSDYGTMSYMCARCNKTITDTIDKVPHKADENGDCTFCGEHMIIEIITADGTFYESNLYDAFYYSWNGAVIANGGTVRLLADCEIGQETFSLINDCDITLDLNGYSITQNYADAYFNIDNENTLTVKNGIIVVNTDVGGEMFQINSKLLVENVAVKSCGTGEYLCTAFCGNDSAKIDLNNITSDIDDYLLYIHENSEATMSGFSFSGTGNRNTIVVAENATLILDEGTYQFIRVITSNSNALLTVDGFCAQKEDGTYYDPAVFSAGVQGETIVYTNVSIVPEPFSAVLVGSAPTVIKGFPCDLELVPTISEGLSYSWSAADADVTIVANATKATVTYPDNFNGDATVMCAVSHANGYVKYIKTTPNVINCPHENLDESLVCALCGKAMTLEFINADGTYYGTELYECYDKYILSNGGTLRLLADCTADQSSIIKVNEQLTVTLDLNGFNLNFISEGYYKEHFFVEGGSLTVKNGNVALNETSNFIIVYSGEAFVDNVIFTNSGNSGATVLEALSTSNLRINEVTFNTIAEMAVSAAYNATVEVMNCVFGGEGAVNGISVMDNATVTLDEGRYPYILIEFSERAEHVYMFDGLCAKTEDGLYYPKAALGEGKYFNISVVPVPFTAEWAESEFNIFAGNSIELEVLSSVNVGATYSWSAVDVNVSVVADGATATVTYPDGFTGDSTISCTVSCDGYSYVLKVKPTVTLCKHEAVDEQNICTSCGLPMLIEYVNSGGTYYNRDLAEGFKKYVNYGGRMRLIGDCCVGEGTISANQAYSVIFDLNGFTLSFSHSTGGMSISSGELVLLNGSIYINGEIDSGASLFSVTNSRLFMNSVSFSDNGNCSLVEVIKGNEYSVISLNDVSINTSCSVFAHADYNSTVSLYNVEFSDTDNKNCLLVSGAASLSLSEGRYPCIKVENPTIETPLCPMEGLCARKADGTYYFHASFTSGEDDEYRNIEIVPIPFFAEWTDPNPTIIRGVSTSVYVSATMTEGLNYTWYAGSSLIQIQSYGSFAMVTYPTGWIAYTEIYCDIEYNGYIVQLSLTPTLIDCAHTTYSEYGFCTVCNTPQPFSDADGNGYYEINNVGNLVYFRDAVNGGQRLLLVELMSDLDLSIVCGETLGSWEPIGYPNGYSGVFYGNGHIIDNVWIYDTKSETVGFFEYFDGIVYDLCIRGNISSLAQSPDGTDVGCAGGIAGYVENASIERCYFEGNVYGSKSAGGLVAILSDNGYIKDCYAKANVASGSNEAAGLVAYKHSGDVRNCFFIGSVETAYGTGDYLVGHFSPSLGTNNCYYLQNNLVTDEVGACTEDDFASGRVAYALNEGKANDNVVWRQDLGINSSPVFTGPIVYYGIEYKCDGSVLGEVYDNTPVVNSVPLHTVNDIGMCTECGQRVGYLKVSIGDSVSYAMTLAEAVTLADKNDATITLLDNMGTLAEPVFGFGEVNCSQITFKLNGKDIVYSDSTFITMNSGTVVLEGNGNVQRSANGVTGGVFFEQAGGYIRLKGGTYPGGLSTSAFLVDLAYDGYYLRNESGWINVYGPSSTTAKTWVEQAPFTITKQPISGNAWLGVPFEFSVETELLNPANQITYSWYNINDSATVVGTNSTLELLFTEAKTETYYCVLVCDGLTIRTKSVAVTAAQCTHPSYTNGFCDNCDEYQPAEKVGNIYQITNGGNLFWLAEQINDPTVISAQKAVLTTDIDLEHREWTTVEGFLGTFDGAGYTIKGFYISVVPSSGCNLGLFGQTTKSAVIKDFTIEGSIRIITMGRSPDKVGVIAASGEDNAANGAYISGIISKITIESTAGIGIKHMGGVVGAMYGGTVEKCVFAGKILYNGSSITELGGVVGYAQKGVINLCANWANVSSATHTGGILGYMNKEDTNVTNCYNYGKITGRNSQWVGAIVGRVRAHGTIIDNYYNTEATTNAYGTGSEGDMTAVTSIGMTSDKFTSGELAWTMNGKIDDGVWKQTLDGVTLPSFTGLGVYYHIGLARCDGVTLEYHFDNTAQTEADIQYADHEYGNDGVCIYCGNIAVATVAITDAVKYFDDLNEAFVFVQGGTEDPPATLKLLCDVELNSTVAIDNGYITLDLNGKKLSGNLPDSVKHLFNLKCNSFTIIDTSSEMTGELYSNDIAIYAEGDVKIYLNSGIVRATNFAFSVDDGTMVQNGGSIIAVVPINLQGNASYTIIDGTVEGENAIQNIDTATVNICGGMFKCLCIIMATAESNGVHNICGGTFVFDEANNDFGLETTLINIFDEGTVKITGGEFVNGLQFRDYYHCRPLSTILADGYAFRDIDGNVIVLEQNQTVIPYKATVSECEVVLEITWGAFEFTYKEDAWDTETLTYESGWYCDEGGNEITVAVKCNCKVDVTVQYKATNSNINAVITDESGEESNGISIPGYGQVKLYVSLVGVPNKEYTKEAIGTVKLILGR